MLIHIRLLFHKLPNRSNLIIHLELLNRVVIKVLFFQKIVVHSRIRALLMKKIVKNQFLGLIFLIIRFLVLKNKLCLNSFNNESRGLSQEFQNKIIHFYNFKREQKIVLVIVAMMN